MLQLLLTQFTRLFKHSARLQLGVFVAVILFSHMPKLFANEPSQVNEDTLIQNYIPEAQALGQTRFKYMFWDLYDATLYSAERPFSIEQAFALKLDYLRDLKGDKIAERSIDEMRKAGFDNEQDLQSWLDKMRRIFPDVKKGDFIVGIKNQAGEAVFYKNNEKLGEFSDPKFSKAFFSIWLGEHDRAKAFKKKLIQP